MGIEDKVAKAKKSDWLTKGLSEAEVKTTVELAKISARIERRRLELGMSQQKFAEFMGVSQGMVSKWESREYNFTVRTLNEICMKADLDFSIDIERRSTISDYKIVRWDSEKMKKNASRNTWTINKLSGEGIA